MRTGRSAKRRRFTFWQLQPPCVVDSAVDLDFSRRQSRVLVDCGSRPVRCAGVDHAGLMFGCGDTVRKLVKDVRLRATERLKNAKKVGATARLSQAPVSRFRYPCVFDLAGRVGVHLAWLCLMQAPGTGARKETLSPVRYGSLNRSSNVRSRHSLFGTSWSGFPTVDFAVVPNHRRRGRCAHVDEGNPGKTVKAEGGVGSSLRNRARPTHCGCVCTSLGVTSTPRQKVPPFVVRTYRRRRGDGWENTPRPTVLAACGVGHAPVL